MGNLARINKRRASELRQRRIYMAVLYLTKLQGKPAKTLWIAEAMGANEAYARKTLQQCPKFKPAEQKGFWVLN